MKSQSLQEERVKWEDGFKVIIEVPVFTKNCIPQELDNLIVILKDLNEEKFFIHRYFEVSGTFVTSVDLECNNASDTLQYILQKYPEGLKTNLI